MTSPFNEYPLSFSDQLLEAAAEPEVRGAAPGTIGFPPAIYADNVFLDYEAKNEQPPAGLKEWRKLFDFHRAQLPVNLRSSDSVRGVRSVAVDVKLTGTGDVGVHKALIDDVGPDTFWKPKDVSGEVVLEIGYDWIGSILKMMHLPAIAPGGKASFKYVWSPKVGAVIAGSEGLSANWTLQRTEGTYLDGEQRLVMLIRRPRNVKDLSLTVYQARVAFDVRWGWSDAKLTKAMIDIPIHINASSPG